MSRWSFRRARLMAVSPLAAVTAGSAPSASSSRTASVRPLSTALRSGVAPQRAAAFTSAPASKRSRIVPR